MVRSIPATAPQHRDAAASGLSIEPATPQPKSLVEQLVEQMELQRPVPDLELRLVRRNEPSPPAEPSARPASDAVSEDPRELKNAPPRPAAPAAPAIDVRAIADKVYHRLVRKEQRARERKGWY
jgi:hypothetical protein